METILSSSMGNPPFLGPASPSPSVETLPGLPGYASAILSYFGIPNATPTIFTFFLISTAVATGWSHSRGIVTDIFRRFLVSTAQVRSRDELYEHMLAWIADQKFANRTRRFVAGMAFSSLFDEANAVDEIGEESLGRASHEPWENIRRAPLQFTPAPGTHFFRYKGKLVMLERIPHPVEKSFYPQETLEFSIMGRDPALLKEMLREAREKFLMKDRSKTVIYRPRNLKSNGPLEWARCLARPSRPLSTVVLDQEQKKKFVDDIKEYLEPKAQKWYSDRGIPYRRGYLLYGPPGTGKSSLSFAASGLLGLKLYVLSLASKSLSDNTLSSLFEALPRRCVVLLEDIDTIGIAQTRQPTTTTTAAAATAAVADPKPKSTATESDTRVSLSGLLNVIDGVASPEGRVLILTTNHPEKLDPALVRPGRVDMKINFQLAGREAIAGLFQRMYEGHSYVDAIAYPTSSIGLSTPPSISNSTDPIDEKAQVANADDCNGEGSSLGQLAEEFAAAVPQRTFSPAEIQGYLLQHKNKPARAVAAIEEWVRENLAAKEGKSSACTRNATE